jgi:hypothetical protein
MTLRHLFAKQVLIRLTDDQTALVCTAKWSLLSNITRVCVSETGPDFALQVTKRGSIAGQERPTLRDIRLE